VTVITALPHARPDNLAPFAPHGWAGVGAAAAVLVWGFAGWEAVSSLSAEYRDPRRDVPRATLIAVVVVGALYLAVAVTSVLVLGPALGDSPAPLADLLAAGVGGPVRAVTAVVAVLLTVGAVNAYLAGASRLGVALARDGALPARLVGTPRKSLAAVTVGGLVAALLPFPLKTSMLLVTGCFTLVYVIGTAAAVKLLPRGWSRRGAGFAFLAVLGLLGLNGPPALLSLAIAAGAILYQAARTRSAQASRDEPAEPPRDAQAVRNTSAKSASPSAIRSVTTAPKPNTNPACALES
jgi:amino acid efflux transporter